MALVNSGVRAITGRLPKVLSPKQHAILDYAIAGGFFAAAGIFWGRNRRAAIASLACGAAETAVALLTDYPGGVAKVIDFETHRRMDNGMAASLEALPSFLNLGASGWFFRAKGIGIATVTALTNPEAAGDWGKRNRTRKIA